MGLLPALCPGEEKEHLTDISDSSFVRSQYGTSANLNARIDLHALYSTNPYGWFRWVLDQLELPHKGRLLELGCGSAAFWSSNRDALPFALRVTLTDLSPGMVARARKKLATQEGPLFAFCVADAQAIPFPAECFDILVANHMLYHVPNRERAYTEILRVLKPGGRFCATTIGVSHMQELEDMLIGSAANYPYSQVPSFSLENAGTELSRHFEDVCMSRYDDSLEVTAIAPLADYVASSGRLTSEELARFSAAAAEQLSAKGSIHITKDSGIFTARKG